MALKLARVTDRTDGTCYHPSHLVPLKTGGSIITGSADTKDENLLVARLDDTVQADCGHYGKIVSASSNTRINGRFAARLTDQVDGDYKATIITASGKTDIN